MRLLIATQNPAKFRRYRSLLDAFSGLSVLSPADLGLSLSIDEGGETAAENARRKASAYALASQCPALGIDEALYIPALPPDEQPGVYVRRSNGRALTDEELLAHYIEKARLLSFEQRSVQWVFALCLALPDGRSFAAESDWTGRLSDEPCLPHPAGYPLSAVLLDGATGKPVTRMTEEEHRLRDEPLAKAVHQLISHLESR